jgi:hypothetical protein
LTPVMRSNGPRGQRRDQMDPAVVPHLRRQRRPSPAPCSRLQPRQLHADAGAAGNDEAVSLTSQRARIKIGAKVVSHGRYVTFQLAEVAVPRQMFAEICRSGRHPRHHERRGIRRQATAAEEVRLDAGKSARFMPRRSRPAAFDRLLRAQCTIYRCRNAPKGRSWAANRAESRNVG